MSEGERTEYRRSPVGSEFQVYNLTPTFTAAENVARIAEIAGSDAEVRHGDALTQVGLDDRAKHSSSNMSAPLQRLHEGDVCRRMTLQQRETEYSSLHRSKSFAVDTQTHGWASPSQTLPRSGMFVSNSLPDRLHLSKGDLRDIDLPLLDTTVTLKVVEFVDEALGLPLYASHEAIVKGLTAAGIEGPEAVLTQPNVSSVMAPSDNGADHSSTLVAINEGPNALAVVQGIRSINRLDMGAVARERSS